METVSPYPVAAICLKLKIEHGGWWFVFKTSQIQIWGNLLASQEGV